MSDEWKFRTMGALGGKRLFRLGLAANYGIDEDGVRAAMDGGVNFFLQTMRDRGLREPLRQALRERRDQVAVGGFVTPGWFGWAVRWSAERLLKQLGTDSLDLLLLGWVGVGSALTEATERELRHLRESGKVRAIGVSIHDRERAGLLAQAQRLDLLMIRYNAAHPGAERDIFPHRAPSQPPALLAYTATAWRRLLRRPSGWAGPVMTAGDCYRFQLSNPAIDLALTGPASRAEVEQNLAALDRGPLSDDESAWMRDFGRAVHG